MQRSPHAQNALKFRRKTAKSFEKDPCVGHRKATSLDCDIGNVAPPISVGGIPYFTDQVIKLRIFCYTL